MAVNVPVPLTTEEENALLAHAQAEGVSVASLIQRAVLGIIKADPERNGRHATAEEVERFFEEAADLVPAGTPALSDEAMSRESIYTREDEWNKNH